MIDNANDSSTSGAGHERRAMLKSDTSPLGRDMTALDILSSCAMALSEQADGNIGGHNVAREREMPMPPAVVSPTTPGVSDSPPTMTSGMATGEGTMVATVATSCRQTGPSVIHKKTLVRAREVSPCSDDSAKDLAAFDTAVSSTASSLSRTSSSRIGDVAQPITQRLRSSMEQSRQSLKQLQDWDRRLGLPKSSAHTCVKTERSRKQLLEGKILKKWDGTPLISFEKDATGAILVKTGNRPKQRNKKKAKKESNGRSYKNEVEEQEAASASASASASPDPPSSDEKKKGRGSNRQQPL